MPPIGETSLANALQRTRESAREHIVRSQDISRSDRELLVSRRWLREIIRGWYLLTTPEAQLGDTVIWHSSFWAFVAAYLRERFDRRYCLSAEASLDLWSGTMGTPKQLTVLTASGGSSRIELPTGTSILTYQNARNLPRDVVELNGVQVMSLGTALVRTTPTFFHLDPLTAEIALRRVRREDLTRALLAEWNAAAANRLSGALSHLERTIDAEALRADCGAAGYRVSGDNPFERPAALAGFRVESPHAGRVETLWRKMQPVVLAARPALPAPSPLPGAYLAQAAAVYTRDAYHSLSIEGYRVTAELIERVAGGDWNPSQDKDRQQIDAMAARGYFDAHERVISDIREVFSGRGAGETFERSLGDWYRALFGPSVQAGILEAWQLAGYRERAVYITGSSHIPPPRDAVPACMEVLFAHLRAEPDGWVRAVLGHFIFVFIHPYADGNGRLARFLMNLMLASAGYDWSILRVENRADYMRALESASVNGDIAPFAAFVGKEVFASAVLPK
jgi:Fic/DOC family